MKFFQESLKSDIYMAHKKPQYLTPNGLVRSSRNPLKENELRSELLKKKKEKLQKAIDTTKVKPLKSLENLKIPFGQNSSKDYPATKRRTLSPEAAKAIAAAISGMLKSK